MRLPLGATFFVSIDCVDWQTPPFTCYQPDTREFDVFACSAVEVTMP